MAYTQQNVEDIEAALVEIAIRGAAEIEINGRRVKYSDPVKLQKLKDIIQSAVNSQTYGGCIDVAFTEVTG